MYKICHFSVVMWHSFYYCNTELPIAPQKFFIFSNFFREKFCGSVRMCPREAKRTEELRSLSWQTYKNL